MNFLKIFDYSSTDVRECSTIGVLGNVFIVIAGYFDYFAKEVLGTSVSFLLMISLVMFVDLVLGIKVSNKKGKAISLEKGKGWVMKIAIYTLFIYVLNTYYIECSIQGHEWIAPTIAGIKIYFMIHVGVWELKSIDRHLSVLGYSFGVLKFVDMFFKKSTKDIEDKLKNE